MCILSLLFFLTNCGKEDKYYQPRITPVEKIFYKHRQSFYVTFPNFVDEELRPNKTYAINYQIPNADKLGDIDVSVQTPDDIEVVQQAFNFDFCDIFGTMFHNQQIFHMHLLY
mgnify:CR=1 FL=1